MKRIGEMWKELSDTYKIEFEILLQQNEKGGTSLKRIHKLSKMY